MKTSKWNNPEFWRRYQREYYRTHAPRLRVLARKAANRRRNTPEGREEYNRRSREYKKTPQWKQYVKKYYKKNREWILKQKCLDNHRLKLVVIKEYGGKCRCCGQSEPAFLSIDHKKGAGYKHKKPGSKKRLTGGSLYRWLKKRNWPKRDFQLLCFLCNVAKEMYGICPHKSKLRGAAFVLRGRAMRTGRKKVRE